MNNLYSLKFTCAWRGFTQSGLWGRNAAFRLTNLTLAFSFLFPSQSSWDHLGFAVLWSHWHVVTGLCYSWAVSGLASVSRSIWVRPGESTGGMWDLLMKPQFSVFKPSQTPCVLHQLSSVHIAAVWAHFLPVIFPLSLGREHGVLCVFTWAECILSKKRGQFVVNPWFPNPKAVETLSCQSRSEVCVSLCETSSVISPWGQFFHVGPQQAYNSCPVNTYSNPQFLCKVWASSCLWNPRARLWEASWTN